MTINRVVHLNSSLAASGRKGDAVNKNGFQIRWKSRTPPVRQPLMNGPAARCSGTFPEPSGRLGAGREGGREGRT